MILTEEQKIEIDKVKSIVVELQRQQDTHYHKLLKDLKVVDQYYEDTIFDYIFNDYINPKYDLWQQETSHKTTSQDDL
jgi:hypothetical protein